MALLRYLDLLGYILLVIGIISFSSSPVLGLFLTIIGIVILLAYEALCYLKHRKKLRTTKQKSPRRAESKSRHRI